MSSPELCNAGRWLLNRRDFLRHGGTGLSGIALLELLRQQRVLGKERSFRPDWRADDPYAARQPQFTPKAKNVLVIFSSGALSHIDAWDYKPELIKRHNQPMP